METGTVTTGRDGGDLAPGAGVRKVVTTTELMEMLARGDKVYLPPVEVGDQVRENYEAADLARLDVPWEDNEITSVTYVRHDEVQCIAVADEHHLYVTDDFIPTHNTSNIIFLKSTDDSMLETLEKMSGKRHTSYIDSKQISQDLDRVVVGRTEGRVSYTMSTVAEPLISFNDLNFLSERNSIVFRAGDAPVWNRNQTILPMSWRLLKDQIVHPGHDYTLQTIPTLSSALEFDVRRNQPDFVKMVHRRMAQAMESDLAKAVYAEAHGYSEIDVERLDPDVYAAEVMEIIDRRLSAPEDSGGSRVIDVDSLDGPMGMYTLEDEAGFTPMFDTEAVSDNDEVIEAAAAAGAVAAERSQLRYAHGTISRDMLVRADGTGTPDKLALVLLEASWSVREDIERDIAHFSVQGESLCSADGREVYIEPAGDARQALATLDEAARAPESRVYADGDVMGADQEPPALGALRVTAAFVEFLANLETWRGLADGRFDDAVALEMTSE